MRQMEIAVNTDLFGEGGSLEQTKALLGKIAEAGFTHIHWCHEWDGEYIYSRSEMEQLAGWLSEYGLKVKALHATKGSARDVNVRGKHYRKDYTSDWEYNRIAGVELIQNRVDLAAAIGAEEIVLHLYVPYVSIQEKPEEKELFYSCVYRSLDELRPYCLERNVRICVENLFDFPGEYMLEAWDRLFSRYPEEFLGLCYDAGHANMIWGQQAPEILQRYKERIFAVHLHDNDGKGDGHLIPGEGTINWQAVMEVVAQSAYQPPLVLELTCREKDADTYLRKAYKAGCYLEELYQNAGNEGRLA